MNFRLEPIVLVSALSLASCGNDENVAPAQPLAEFEQLCGVDGPIQLLPFEPSPMPDWVEVQAITDHFIITKSLFDNDPDTSEYEVWSVGRCGEDPLLLSTYGPPQWFEPWPDIPFVCERSTGRIFALDPSGVLPPNEVFQSDHCSSFPSSHGVVAILGEGGTGPLVLQPWPQDPLTESAEQVALVDEVTVPVVPGPELFRNPVPVLSVGANEVFAITTADELVVVSLDDLGVEVLAEGVREFRRGGQHLLWQSTEISNDDPDLPEGPIYLLDLETKSSTFVDETALAYGSQPWVFESLDLLHYRVSPGDGHDGDRWFQLDTLKRHYQVPDLEPERVIDDTRALMVGDDGSVYAFDVANSALSFIYPFPAHAIRYEEKGLYVVRLDGLQLDYVPYDGELPYDDEARTLARHASSQWVMLSDERVITPMDVDADHIGDLVISNPDTLEESHVAYATRTGWTYVHSSSPEPDAELDLVSYVSVDPEQFGVWLAKPAK